MGALDAFRSLFTDSTNEVKPYGSSSVLDELPELTLDTKDSELVEQAELWEQRYQAYETEIKKRQEKNKEYWKGKHEANKYDEKGQVDNLIFEALETLLPLATKKNPEPFVRGSDSEEGRELAKNVQSMLIYHADRLRMKLRLKSVARDWAIKLIGVKKHGWSITENDIISEVRKPENFIFDTEGTINCDMEYTGRYIGERMTNTASELINKFPKKAEYIKKKVNGKLGTTVHYTEWWACNPADYVFWKLDKEILGKSKNPHWNYDQQVDKIDEYGVATPEVTKGNNHFNVPKPPYTFLGGVYNTGDCPHDETSLIEQSIPMQDIINDRQKQITLNVASMNPGLIVSLSGAGMNEDQATRATEAYRAGGTVCIPTGNPTDAIYQPVPNGLPGDVFQQLADTREELRSSFGIRGSTPTGTINEQTVGGKQLIREQDSDRIGGGITEYLEQFADNEFNWWVQLMMVYYDEEHTASILGKEKALEYTSLSSSDFSSKLTVSVKEGSLIPDSDIEKAEEARQLLSEGNIDPTTAFDRMGFSNPRETAERTYMWKADPALLFPEIGAQIEQKQAMQAEQQMLQEQALIQK